MTPAGLLALLTSYLLGSIPTGFLLVKWLKRVDVRTIGSGNIGATNVARVAGLWASVSVFLMDAAKGVLAVVVVAPWLMPSASALGRLGCGLAAIIGHNFPIFLNFKGGKGVATTIGVLLSAMPLVGVIYLLIWGVCVAMWRYVSVGSMAAAAAIPIVQLVMRQSPAELLVGSVLTLLIVVRHRANIERLLQGREHRVGRSR